MGEWLGGKDGGSSYDDSWEDTDGAVAVPTAWANNILHAVDGACFVGTKKKRENFAWLV